MSRQPKRRPFSLLSFYRNAVIHRHILKTTSKLSHDSVPSSVNPIYCFSFSSPSYVARIDENSLQGTALIFTDPYVSRVYDDDTGKNGVFSLTLLGNNGTFEISPNVAERRANFLIYVRDNHLLDFEMRHSVQFQVSFFEYFTKYK